MIHIVKNKDYDQFIRDYWKMSDIEKAYLQSRPVTALTTDEGYLTNPPFELKVNDLLILSREFSEEDSNYYIDVFRVNHVETEDYNYAAVKKLTTMITGSEDVVIYEKPYLESVEKNLAKDERKQ